jgi:alpha-L-rhamnosidase
MKKNHSLLGLLLSLMSLGYSYGQEFKTQITSLTCEYLENPLGIDVIQSRLSWKINSTEINVSQSAYRILVASSLDLLDRNEGDLWDTGGGSISCCAAKDLSLVFDPSLVQ